ncbi:MAG: sigma-70 family RNA polymerase sigma factor [Oscillospiraceae bacterium]|nr:sigma-70 family RNA polymerase sigma factor [Oscillospiraceae bacterium]
MEDSKIIEMYMLRDAEAITESNNKYGDYCFAVAENILKNREDAEECVSDTWLRAWNSIPPKKPEKLQMFFAKITRNLAFTRYREKTAEKRGGGEIHLVLDELSQCIAGNADIESDYMGKELGSCIRDFVRTLPERECNIFLRRYFFTESVAEIAGKYGIRESNVMVILSRTRKKLKAHLIKEGYFDEKY